ncbi:hypothetical protein MTBBW1_580005 [Desulfamplus magnetovallimortis]|uniref:Uncharacterized protein n=1 Tax=Desulfamplus magnetovallimortis TaxID=1246637 RepID=A0A1W1HI88_9BACT|nr:hypothetical protein MTBBW1_580005 [Desulfamplus magnetovallimortis]
MPPSSYTLPYMKNHTFTDCVNTLTPLHPIKGIVWPATVNLIITKKRS